MPVVSPMIKIMALILAGSFVFAPVQQLAQAGTIGNISRKIVNTTTKTLIEKGKEKQKQIDNPNYVPKKKMPIIAGYKKGRNPLPKSVTPVNTYRNIWLSIMSELGLSRDN